MTEVLNWSKVQSAPPSAYVDFIARARQFAASKGVVWDIQYDAAGELVLDSDWDLRILTGSHDKHASRLGSFAIDEQIQATALRSHWAFATLPPGKVLNGEVRAFIRALVVQRCMDARVPRDTRHLARVWKSFFSSIGKMPWELSTEDFDRYAELPHQDAKVMTGMKFMASVINENLLSKACPIGFAGHRRKRWEELQTSLVERKSQKKLPDKESLYELARIVFQQKPAQYVDLLRFCAFKVILLTGFRLNEALMLPLDCLRWEEHVDVITGLPADQVGGVSRTLRLRYFALKQEEGKPDLLVEEHQWVPTRFLSILASAIEQVQAASAGLRRILQKQHELGVGSPHSDLRRFKTSSGVELTTADLIFLTPYGVTDLPNSMLDEMAVTTLSQNSMYLAMGCVKSKWSYSLFARYGDALSEQHYFIKPHSLRHLLNTELFKLGVSDTVITQQFGRMSVAQSYEYDHRSLSEKLSFIRLPESAKDLVRPGSSSELVAKMVVGGMIPSSHIAKSFKAIQASSGDEVAFRYLVANSDGFHVTPYGFCLNSFSMNPCARHLKCFDRCKHYTASGLPEHRVTLGTLRAQLLQARQAAAAKPAKTIGRMNQIAHADTLLAGVDAALAAAPDTPVFGGNVDHSKPIGDVLT